MYTPIVNEPSESLIIKKKESQKKKFKRIARFATRLFTVLLASLGSAITAFSAVGLDNQNVYCIEDSFFNSTISVNDYLYRNKELSNSLMIFTGILLDLQLVMTCYIWLKLGNSLKPFITLLFISLTKLIIDKLFNFRYPEGMIYEYPGFPSITVPYTKTSTLFFSFNAAVSVLCSLVANKLKKKWLVLYGIICLIIYSIISIFMRFHFSIDIFSGIVCSHYFYYMSKKPTRWVENKFIFFNLRYQDNEDDVKFPFQKINK